MKADNFAEHHASTRRPGADFDDLRKAALHLNRRFGNTRRTHQFTRNRCKTRYGEFVHIGRILARTEIHLTRNSLRHDIHDKLFRLADVVQRILGAAVGADHGTEADNRWIGARRGEKAERRKVGNSGRADGRDKGDGPGHNGSDQQLVNIARAGFLGIDDHVFLSLKRVTLSFHEGSFRFSARHGRDAGSAG